MLKALVPKGNGHRLPGLYLFICYEDCEQDLAKNAFWGSLVALEPLNIPTPEPLTTIGFIHHNFLSFMRNGDVIRNEPYEISNP